MIPGILFSLILLSSHTSYTMWPHDDDFSFNAKKPDYSQLPSIFSKHIDNPIYSSSFHSNSSSEDPRKNPSNADEAERMLKIAKMQAKTNSDQAKTNKNQSSKSSWSGYLWNSVKGAAAAAVVTACGMAAVGASSGPARNFEAKDTVGDRFLIRMGDGYQVITGNDMQATIALWLSKNRSRRPAEIIQEMAIPLEEPGPIQILEVLMQGNELSHDDRGFLYKLLTDIYDRRVYSNRSVEESCEQAFMLGQRGGMTLFKIIDGFLDFHSKPTPKNYIDLLYFIQPNTYSPQTYEAINDFLKTSYSEEEKAHAIWSIIKRKYIKDILRALANYVETRIISLNTADQTTSSEAIIQ